MPFNEQHNTAVNGHSLHHSLETARSPAVQDIMGKMPHWIIRSGITFIALLTLGLLAGAWFFHYPEAVNTKVTIRQQQQSYQAAGSIPAAGAWKIKPGQQVLIKLTAYPYQEFGMLQGTVTGMYATEKDTGFRVNIQLPRGLQTTAGRTIPAYPRLDGAAEIMTEDKSVLERIFGRLWKRE